jgi:hypothetical protein
MRLLPLVFALALGLLLSACGGSGGGDARAQLAVDSLRLVQQPSGKRQITGRVVNTGDAPMSVVQLTVSLFDADNVGAGTAQIQVEDVPADSSTFFRHTLDTSADVRGARLKGLMVP